MTVLKRSPLLFVEVSSNSRPCLKVDSEAAVPRRNFRFDLVIDTAKVVLKVTLIDGFILSVLQVVLLPAPETFR